MYFRMYLTIFWFLLGFSDCSSVRKLPLVNIFRKNWIFIIRAWWTQCTIYILYIYSYVIYIHLYIHVHTFVNQLLRQMQVKGLICSFVHFFGVFCVFFFVLFFFEFLWRKVCCPTVLKWSWVQQCTHVVILRYVMLCYVVLCRSGMQCGSTWSVV